MLHNIPLDLKAETLLGYLPKEMRHIELRGSHKRNAYEDIADISEDNKEAISILIARNGMYDILPESMFHPIDRFDNIPANEYKERFKEECELQQQEEENARKYFLPFDNFLMELSTIISKCKSEDEYVNAIQNIICDRIPQDYLKNRFIRSAVKFIPFCSNIRGNKGLFTLILRNILFEEGISLEEKIEADNIKDISPRYKCTIDEDEQKNDAQSIFLGNELVENITTYCIKFWKEDECDDSFLNFISEIKLFESFLNDFFMGLETRLVFDISTDSLPVRLADDVFYTYLDYNTNI